MEVRAVPLATYSGTGDGPEPKTLATTEESPLGGGTPAPCLDHPYEVTVRDKMFYHAISCMKAYENYSFEELRFVSPTKKRLVETMLVRCNNDGTYTANWNPSSTGWYLLQALVDGFEIGGSQHFHVEVKDPPQGSNFPNKQTLPKLLHQPSKLRKFVCSYSSGLRIRTHPSLQSEQIGLVKQNEIISFIEELHNDDGVWLQLTTETIRNYCHNGFTEAWCLQYNQHLGKTLLVPVEEPKSILSELLKEKDIKPPPMSLLQSLKPPAPQAPKKAKSGVYHVVKCGASGHNIRSRPSFKASPVGMLLLGNSFTGVEEVANAEGTWIRLDKDSRQRYCFNSDGEAWSLAHSSDSTFLQHETELMQSAESDEEQNSSNKGYDFGAAISHPPTFGNFGTPPASTPSTSLNTLAESERTDSCASTGSRVAALQKWLKECSQQQQLVPEVGSRNRDIPPELHNVSVKELVKAIGESRANGNGATPPQTPPSTPPVPRRGVKTDAIPIPRRSDLASDKSGSPKMSPPVHMTSSSPTSALIPRRASQQSDTSASSHFSSLLKEFSQSSATGCMMGCITQRNTISPLSTPGTPGTPKKEVVKSVTQTGTQTSPDTDIKGHFSIGTRGPDTPSRLSPKLSRKDRQSRQLRGKRDRSNSPAPSLATVPAVVEKDKLHAKEKIKEAMSPLIAECLRSVFAAFLWHEGIVHDAMACSSFLKFNPQIQKQVPKNSFVKFREKSESPSNLTKEQKARLRHSVEVTMPTFLNNILTHSNEPLNANINRNKLRKTSIPIKEELTPEPLNLTKDSKDSKPSPSPKKEKSQLPLSLQYLVLLWEQISTAASHAISQQLILPSPIVPSKVIQQLEKGANDKRPKKKKDYNKILTPIRSNVIASGSGALPALERETVCELCGTSYPHPVTYHMRQCHPGCGDHAGGKGYNSGGIFCGGWAGNCGDGGMGGSNWYLVCDKCRERFLRNRRQEKSKKSKKKSGSNKCLSPMLPMEAHQVMKNNALFLLELSSTSCSDLSSRVPSRTSLMPSVSEQGNPFDQEPFNLSTFQCLEMLGVQQAYNEMIGEEFLSEDDIRALQNGAESLGDDLGGIRREAFKNQVEPSTLRTFHRSISVGLTSRDWNKQQDNGIGGEGRVIMTRRRNNSSDDKTFLCQPSASLTKLVTSASELPGEFVLQRPVMQFILQRHDLASLHLAMQHALRKASCRVYAMQAFNWLLHSVTQPVSLHDLLWCFVAALTPHPPMSTVQDDDSSQPLDGDKKESESDGISKALKVDKQKASSWPTGQECEHPISDLVLAGEAVHPLSHTFHTLLQAISDLMMVLPVGSALQQMAMRCWAIRFLPADHAFLHRSHVFSNISKILARTEDADTDVADLSSPAITTSEASLSGAVVVEALKDITYLAEIKASSRSVMVTSLTDNSTETFWESGDEDRNKTKVIALHYSSVVIHPCLVYVHIDNGRDLGNKVNHIAFKCGPNPDELRKLKQVDVENRFAGWINCALPKDNRHSMVRIELKGSDNTLRLRQVRLLGKHIHESIAFSNQLSTAQIQQKNCEAETLKVFRLLTSQVFGKLLSGEPDRSSDNLLGDATNDLKEHMVGILFSRSKLTHLQKQVCAHIVAAIRKEASRVRDEWEVLLCSKSQEELPKSSDAYCFEMLSMVLALSGSNVGRAYLAGQAGLLRDLFSLLHTGSARVQRQVTSLLRRVLPVVSPQNLATILGVPSLPPADFNILSSSVSADQPHDPFRLGILDVFLACIAKALTVQTKVKGSSKGLTTCTLATSIHPRDYVGARWWLRGCMTRKLVEVIIQLLKDMAAGKLTEEWAVVTKSAIAENILNLTKLDDQYKVPNECLHTPTLWLALASLCVLDQEHVERLSSGHWAGGTETSPRPLCDNHDDGETPAIILCSFCGNLCADCDRFLHLHRKTRSHQRQVFKEEEEAIKVDLHEGCGRTKLFWVIILADSKTLKAMVEFREGARSKTTSSLTCRFCGQAGLLGIGNVCGESECQEHARNACSKVLPCGHSCGGIANESPCLPCLHGCSGGLKQDGDDMCMICFTEGLACAPALQLKCAHVFHFHCCQTVLTKRWVGPRITFGFSLCPICKAPMEHPVLKQLLEPIEALYDDVKRKALMRLEYEGLHKAEAISTPGARFYQDPAGYAMERYAYYVCFKCKKAYYGGEARCDAEAGPVEDYNPAELVCGACSDVSRAQMCPKHGTDFLEYKCRYCCSVAVFFCFGTTHFCNACHDDFQRVTGLLKQDLPQCPAGPRAKQLEGDECPLHVKHPPTGEEFALGCGVCRNAHTF